MNKFYNFFGLPSGRGFQNVTIFTLVLTGLLATADFLQAQVNVTSTGGTPMVAYPTLAAAVTAINGGTHTGSITVNVDAGHTETLAGRINLTATGTMTEPIIIQKAGAGANPALTAYTGVNTPTSAERDGMFSLSGSDWVTIDGINLQENPANTDLTTWMEYGYGLFKNSDTDGCQNNTIKNCAITLNRDNVIPGSGVWHPGSNGIVVLWCSATSDTGIAPTTPDGSNSFNKFYSNTIQNVQHGITFMSFAAPTPFTLADTGNDVGGYSASTGNTIVNFGGGAATMASADAVFINNQWGINCSYNTINNNNGAGVNHPNILYGIWCNLSSTSTSATINNNNVTVKGGGTTQVVAAIRNELGATPAGNTVSISNNTITGEYLTATTGGFYGIWNSAAQANLIMNGNTVSNMSYSSATLTGTGVVYGIFNGASNAGMTVNVRNNTVSNINRTGTAGGTTIGIFTVGVGGMNVTINSNTVENMSVDGTGAASIIYGIQTTNGTIVVDSNLVNNLACLKTTGTGTLYGIFNINAPSNENYNYNTVSNLTHNGTGTTYGIYAFTATGTRTVSHNTIFNLVTGGTTIAGINQSSSSPNIFNNKIYNIQSNSTGAPTVSGLLLSILLGTAGVANIYNNLIGDLKAPNANSAAAGTAPSVRGVNITVPTANTMVNLSYNTVYLNTSSTGANFATAALFVTSSATATTVNLTFQNNILVNLSTPAGGGNTVAFQRSGTALNNYNDASNNNLFYAGTPGPDNLIFFDGTNEDETLTTFKNRVSPRETNSITENPVFLSASGASADFLHLNPAIPTQAESSGVNVAGITGDYDGIIRQGNAGYAGTGTAPDIGADEGDFIAIDLTGPSITYANITSSICIIPVSLSATITDAGGVNTTAGTKPRLWFKKSTEANALPASNTAATDGWKYTEATNSSSPFNFTIDYSLLTSAVVSGDIIEYFVVAQDLVVPPNISTNATVYPAGYTPASVALAADAFPVSDVKSYNILAVPVTITASASPNSICITGNVQLSLGGNPVTGAQLQWESSLAGANNWTPIMGATTSTYNVMGVNASTDFRCVVSCGGTPIAASPSTVASVTVISPAILTTTPGFECGPGPVSVTVGATANPGAMISWYETPTGGMSVGSGTSFQTPPITTTTDYYVAANDGGGTTNTGLPAALPTATSGAGTTNFGIVFDAISAFTLSAVTIYPVSAAANTPGTVTIDVVDGTGAILHSQIVDVFGNPVASPVAQTVVLNFNISPGTNLKLRPGARSASITGLLFGPSASAPGGNYGYPFTIPGVVTLLHSTLTAPPTNTPRLDLYYHFYNWVVTTGCETPRIPVTASVIVNPGFTLSSTVIQPTICTTSNGSIDLTVTGGVGPFTYNWSTPNGSGLVNGQEDQSSLTVGSYFVSVTGANNCTATLLVSLVGPGGCDVCPVVGALSASPTSVCLNETVTLTASSLADMGITYGITFRYFDAPTATPYVGGTVIATIPNGTLTDNFTQAQTTASFSTGGTYYIYAILDHNPTNPACRPFAEVILPAGFNNPNGSNLSVNLAVLTLATCPDAVNGIAQAVAQNGVPPYTFLWSNGETTQTATSLAVGAIGATVTDAAGCAIAVSVSMGHSSDLSAGITLLENPGCPGSGDGSAQVVPAGGQAPFTYLWSNGETTAVAVQLPAGNAGATLTDANGCSAVANITLTPPPALAAMPVVADVSCFGGSDGSAELNPTGGTAPYTIAWSTGAGGPILVGTAAGTYQGSVTDDRGCVLVVPVDIQEPALLTLQVDATSASCYAANDGAVAATPGGGTPPYNIHWNNGATGATLSTLPPGQYMATTTDAHGCVAVSNAVQINEPPALSVALQAFDAPCGQNGSIVSTVSGGTSPYTYAWNNGLLTPNLNMLAAGNYSVVVTDANGCVADATTTVQALNHAPYFTFTGNPGFEAGFIDPPGGTPSQTFRFEARYFDADGDLPQPGYPRLYLDFEGDGVLTGSNDQILLLTESDPADDDPTDGKDYYAIRTGIPSSPNYQTVVRAYDLSGCLGNFGPVAGPDILKSVDIFLFANDIQFSNIHPDPQETITVSATIHNESDFEAEIFVCRLTNMNTGVEFDPIVVSNMAAQSTTTVSWTIVTPPDPSWNPMKVEIDATNLITEPNELDNQAIRPFINGDYNLPGTILVDAQVTPGTSAIAAQSTLTLSGTAVYDGTAISLSNSNCAGAPVIATLLETGQTFAGFTNNSGQFVLSFPQPLLPGDYHISGMVTDYTLQGAFMASFSVTLFSGGGGTPCLKPDLSCQVELDQYELMAGESVHGYVQVSNTGNSVSTATQLKVQAPGASPAVLFLDVPPLQPNATTSIPLPAIECPASGTIFIQGVVDYDNIIDECFEQNNANTALVDVNSTTPDIVPVSWNVSTPNLPLCNDHTITYRLQNNGGVAAGAFTVQWEVWSNGLLQYASTAPVAGLLPGGTTYVSFIHTFLSADDYTLILNCDIADVVAESDENNNLFTRIVPVYTCPVGADLVFGNCQTVDVTPADPQMPGDITLTALLTNKGNAAATAPFTVQLRISHAGPGMPFYNDYFLTITDDLAPGASVPVSFVVPKPPAGANTLGLTADADAQVDELNESNNTAGDALDWNFSLGSFCCTSCMFWQKPVTSPNLWFSVGVFNDGQYEASAVPVQFEISGPGLSGWVNLGVDVVDNLGRTCSCPAGAALADPFSFPDVGTYTVRMTVDPNNLYEESDETDNVLTVQVTVRPDMQVLSQFIAPSEIHPDVDEPVVFTVSYENTGFSNPTETMELKLLVDGFPLDSALVPGLLSGDRGSVQFPTSWSSNLVGVHVARAVIDHDGAVMESNEANNEATRALVIGEAANFRFTGFAPAMNYPTVGQPLAITALIENNGDLTGTGRYQLAYVNETGDTIPVYNKVLTLAAGQQQTVQFVWPVADAETVLVGKMVNTTPQESRYDDNTAWAVLGGLALSVFPTPELCIPQTGTATVSVSGGTPPYHYSWSTGQISSALSGLNAGNYALTTTDDAGRSAVAYFTIAHEPAPELVFSVTDAGCEQSDGAISMTANHITLPYSIAWNTGATTAALSGLTPALYTVSVTDALGCTAVEAVIVAFDALQAGNSNVCGIGYPTVVLAQAEVDAGATQTISGRDFFLNGLARLTVTGEQTSLAMSLNIPVDGTGQFEYQLPIPAATPQGQYRVTVLDAVSGFTAPIKNFQVINPTPPEQDDIIITYPVVPFSFDAHSSQTIEWEQRILQKPGYPYTGQFRQYRYWVDISKDNGPWVRMGVVEGFEKSGTTLGSSFAYEVPVAFVSYRVRIQDAFDPGIFAISENFTSVLPDGNTGVIRLKWDWSYGNPEQYRNIVLNGVAADGAARIFLEVKSPNLSQVSVLLTDPEFPGVFDTRLLGKVMVATVANQYSEEANAATAFTDATVADNGTALFWYVAPEDFARSAAEGQLKERNVRAVFQIEYLDGSTETRTQDIRIVRPPLMMVHGLGGDETSWDVFSQYLTENTWTVAQPVRMNPTASFDFNASVMVLTGDKAIPQNADEFYPCFPCVIEQMRQKGFAANRVDYLAHSMGGSVFRNVLTSFYEAYYRNGASAGWKYKNYGKGYANKVITIGTPHKGSIMADIIDRYVDELPSVLETGLDLYRFFDENGFPFTFIEKKQGEYQATSAVSDLQVSGGKSFTMADVRAHLIGGDYLQGYQTSFPSLIDQDALDFLEDVENSMDLVHTFFRAASLLETDPKIVDGLSKISKSLNKAQQAVLFLEVIADFLNYSTFVWESDLVVHLESQLSDLSRYAPTVTIVDRVVHSPPLDILPGSKELASTEIINKAFTLLNTPVAGNQFGPIPAAINFKNNTPQVAQAAKPASTPCPVSLFLRDTAKMSILSPAAPVVTSVDSMLSVQIALFDTTGLIWAEVYFQGKSYTLPTNFVGTYQLDLSTGVNQLDSQEVTLIAHYIRNDTCLSVFDKVAVQVLPSEPLLGFEVFPAVHYLFPGQAVLPRFRATFPNGNSGELQFSPSIAVSVADTGILTHQNTPLRFLGKTQGTTFGVFSYGGFQDTVYFVVLPALNDLPNLPPPVASFTFTETTSCAGAEVHFENNSLNADAYLWEFSDGETSTEISPVHVYQQPGYHQAFLTASNTQTGLSSRYSVAIEVELPEGCGKTINGALYWKGDGLAGVSQALVGLTGDVTITGAPTPASGAYTFSVDAGSNVMITPQKNINPLNGLDAADATAIQQHLVGISPITDFFRLLAADVNKSYSISTLDAVLIRQALLGNPLANAILNNTKSWRFVPTDYAYPNPAGPFSLPVFPEKRVLNNVTADMAEQDFYGVKVGDVIESGSVANPANKPGAPATPLVWTVRDQILKAGEPLTAQFAVLNFTDIAAFQFGLQFDPAALRFERLEVLCPDLPLDPAGNFGTYNIAAGELRIVWTAAAGVTLLQAKPVFRLHFTALQNGVSLSRVMHLAPAILAPVAYNTELIPSPLHLFFSDNGKRTAATERDLNLEPSVLELQLMQNHPNPFSDGTIIGFVLPESCEAQLRVLDAQGRELLNITRNRPAGYQEEIIHVAGMTGSGILYYELTTPFGSLVRKMTFIRK